MNFIAQTLLAVLMLATLGSTFAEPGSPYANNRRYTGASAHRTFGQSQRGKFHAHGRGNVGGFHAGAGVGAYRGGSNKRGSYGAGHHGSHGAVGGYRGAGGHTSHFSGHSRPAKSHKKHAYYG